MIDHDRLFKELLLTFFLEFLDLFVPEVRALEDDSVEFIDKELFTDITSGDRHLVDILAKVRFKGKDTFFLIHVESQAQHQPDFAKRMFRYFARLHEKYDLPVFPVGLLTYEAPMTIEPEEYKIAFDDRPVLRFWYRTIQLNQFSWRQFLGTENPVATALMAKMNVAPEDRPRVKLEFAKLLAGYGLSPAKTHLLLGFVDSYIRLDEEGKKVYQTELEKLAPAEKEKTMELTLSWREEALLEGLQQGRQEGRQEGMLSLITHQIERKFGPIGAGMQEQVSALTSGQLEELGDMLPDFDAIEDLAAWLQTAHRVSGAGPI
jgi:hypothetical protein